MVYNRNRKYPRVHSKKAENNGEKAITFSAAAALGILALSFAKGMFWGYLLKRKLG